jgi:hypothetical protein
MPVFQLGPGTTSSQTSLSDRPQRSHLNVSRSGSFSRTSAAASIMVMPQPGQIGSSPASRGKAGSLDPVRSFLLPPTSPYVNRQAIVPGRA